MYINDVYNKFGGLINYETINVIKRFNCLENPQMSRNKKSRTRDAHTSSCIDNDNEEKK